MAQIRIGDWKRWQKLASWERRFLLRVWIRMLLVQVRLPFDPELATRRQRVSAAKALLLPAGMEGVAFARRCQALVALAANRLPRPANCLPQALVLEHELLRYGLAAELKIGVHSGKQPFLAHAWVEYAGMKLGDNNEGYQSFEGFR